MRGEMAMGFKAQATRWTSTILAPTTFDTPRRIVSTSGNSGILFSRHGGTLGIGAVMNPEFTVAEVARLWSLDVGKPNSGEFGYIEQMPVLFRERS